MKKLQERMRVWKVLPEDEEQKYLKMRQWTCFESAMPLGEKVILDGVTKYVHHMDGQED